MKNLLLFLFSPGMVFAQYTNDYKYDYNTNSQYTIQRNHSGSTTVNGYNYNTGATWSSEHHSDGSSNGRDSNGNYWQYNSESGNYYNYGTGKSCYGKGVYRTCTGGK